MRRQTASLALKVLSGALSLSSYTLIEFFDPCGAETDRVDRQQITGTRNMRQNQ
jgi:hypothetical protein